VEFAVADCGAEAAPPPLLVLLMTGLAMAWPARPKARAIADATSDFFMMTPSLKYMGKIQTGLAIMANQRASLQKQCHKLRLHVPPKQLSLEKKLQK
jgi:hypothetical protein